MLYKKIKVEMNNHDTYTFEKAFLNINSVGIIEISCDVGDYYFPQYSVAYIMVEKKR
jgi:hypothetical protein